MGHHGDAVDGSAVHSQSLPTSPLSSPLCSHNAAQPTPPTPCCNAVALLRPSLVLKLSVLCLQSCGLSHSGIYSVHRDQRTVVLAVWGREGGEGCDWARERYCTYVGGSCQLRPGFESVSVPLTMATPGVPRGGSRGAVRSPLQRAVQSVCRLLEIGQNISYLQTPGLCLNITYVVNVKKVK